MRPYTRNMTQDATYWPPGINDGFGGVGYGDPVHIKCRWQDTAVLFRDSEGREVTSSSVVYPDRELAITGKLARGAFDGRPHESAKEIRQVGQSPSLKGNEVLHKTWL